MSKTKIYEHLRCTYKRYKRKDHDSVEFTGGHDNGVAGKVGGKLATADPDLQKWAESHPEFGKEFVLKNEVESDGKTAKTEARDTIVVEEVNSIGAAKAWLKENASNHNIKPTAEDLMNGGNIQEFIAKNDIKFPNLFKD